MPVNAKIYVAKPFADGVAGLVTARWLLENRQMRNSHKSGDVGERLPSDLVFTN